ncbi:MAG: hypothetical protein R8K48_09670 [Gallionella sp.]
MNSADTAGVPVVSLLRRLLLFDILTNDGNRCAAARALFRCFSP